MRLSGLLAIPPLLLAGCGSRDNPSAADPGNEVAPVSNEVAASPAPATPAAPAAPARWDLRSGDEGVALALLGASGGTTIRLFCPSAHKRLLINVPGFKPIGSEERLSFGSGGEVVALVADTRGDGHRGGVSGTVELPAGLAALLKGPVSASYGAQRSGPHPAPPQAATQAFAAACQGRAAAKPTGETATAAGGPCRMQDGKKLDGPPLRAVGTEPFWGAKIEGRCVSYSHPDDQKGTRVWTRYAAGAGGGTWTGALGGRRFELRIRSRPGCSDGMSDKRYPLAVELVVNGEQRRGCAEPI
jgi:uncharacterized membrane protein